MFYLSEEVSTNHDVCQRGQNVIFQLEVFKSFILLFEELKKRGRKKEVQSGVKKRRPPRK